MVRRGRAALKLSTAIVRNGCEPAFPRALELHVQTDRWLAFTGRGRSTCVSAAPVKIAMAVERMFEGPMLEEVRALFREYGLPRRSALQVQPSGRNAVHGVTLGVVRGAANGAFHLTVGFASLASRPLSVPVRSGCDPSGWNFPSKAWYHPGRVQPWRY